MLNLMMRSLFRRKVRTLLTAISIANRGGSRRHAGRHGVGLRTGYGNVLRQRADLVLMQGAHMT
jgi:hypothetical protein